MNQHIEHFKKMLVKYGYDNRYPQVFDRLAEFNAAYYNNQAKKGIMLLGATGNGKTQFLEFMQKFYKMPLYSALSLVATYKINPEGCRDLMNMQQTAWNDGKQYDLCIDDIGTDEKSVNFGEHKEVLEELLYLRYSLYKTKGAKTFLTSNKTMAKLELQYSSRITSRLNEMCTIFELDAITCPDSRLQSKFKSN